MNGTPNLCTIEECPKPHVAKGLCSMHYNRLRKTGTTSARRTPTTAERFWAKVDKTSTCWLWTGHRAEYGHATFKLDGRNTSAYRYAWEQLRGPIPDSLVLDHICRIPWCVNPDHLEPVTNGENVLRGIGPGAVNKRKTHCKRGHEFAGDNLRITPAGYRNCRECERQKIKRQRAEGKRVGIRYVK